MADTIKYFKYVNGNLVLDEVEVSQSSYSALVTTGDNIYIEQSSTKSVNFTATPLGGVPNNLTLEVGFTDGSSFTVLGSVYIGTLSGTQPVSITLSSSSLSQGDNKTLTFKFKTGSTYENNLAGTVRKSSDSITPINIIVQGSNVVRGSTVLDGTTVTIKSYEPYAEAVATYTSTDVITVSPYSIEWSTGPNTVTVASPNGGGGPTWIIERVFGRSNKDLSTSGQPGFLKMKYNGVVYDTQNFTVVIEPTMAVEYKITNLAKQSGSNWLDLYTPSGAPYASGWHLPYIYEQERLRALNIYGSSVVLGNKFYRNDTFAAQVFTRYGIRIIPAVGDTTFIDSITFDFEVTNPSYTPKVYVNKNPTVINYQEIWSGTAGQRATGTVNINDVFAEIIIGYIVPTRNTDSIVKLYHLELDIPDML